MIRERESNPYSSAASRPTSSTCRRDASPEGGRGVTLEHPAGQAPGTDHHRAPRAAPRRECRPRCRVAASPTRTTGACASRRCDVHPAGIRSAADVGAWAPLLIRDIPVTLDPRPAHGSGLAPLEAAEYIDTLIVDTSLADDAPAALESGAPPAPRGSRRAFMVSDFSWPRTFPLRAQAARAFDPPEERARLQSIREGSTGSPGRGTAVLPLARRPPGLAAARDGMARRSWMPRGKTSPSFTRIRPRSRAVPGSPSRSGERPSRSRAPRTGARRSAGPGRPGRSRRRGSCCWPRSTA